jgi:hypothetical protein
MRNEERGKEKWEVDFLILYSSFLIPHFLKSAWCGQFTDFADFADLYGSSQ